MVVVVVVVSGTVVLGGVTVVVAASTLSVVDVESVAEPAQAVAMMATATIDPSPIAT
jgi:hypothetical protein